MAKTVLVLVTVALLIMGVLFIAVFAHIPLGEPRLRTEFYPLPPWQLKPGNSLEVSMGVANDAWLLAWAKNIRATVLVPEGFTVSQSARPLTDANKCELDFFTLHGGDGIGNGFIIKASNNVTLGNYTITVKVLGENVPEKIFTPEVVIAP